METTAQEFMTALRNLGSYLVFACLALTAPQQALADPPQQAAADAYTNLAPSVVAWGGISSLTAVLDMVTAAGPQLGLPPADPASPKGSWWQQAETSAKAMGISNLSWLRRDQPIRFFLQDEGGPPAVAAGVVLLPMTSQAAVLQALAGAQVGAEGHAAIFIPTDTDLHLYLDFLPDQLAVTFETSRWQRAAPVASGPLGKAAVPGLFSAGISVANLAALRPKELQKLKDALRDPKGLPKSAQLGATQYSAVIKQIAEELDTFELVIGGDKTSLQVGFRVRGRPSTAMAKALQAGAGRSIEPLARLLPAKSYFAAASDVDPQPGLAQLPASFAILDTALKIPKRQKVGVQKQFTALAQGLTGQVALGLYPDGDSALGLLTLVGAKDPAVFRREAARFAGQLVLLLMDIEAQKTAAFKDKLVKNPEKAKLEALARKGLAKGTLKPLVDAIQPKAQQAGVNIAQVESNERGLACDALVISFDWAKLRGDSAKDLSMGPAVLGKGLTFAACSTDKFVVLAIGPSALDHARRVADNRPGGLGEQPGYRAALAQAVAQPSSLMLVDPLEALVTFQGMITDAGLRANWLDALAGALPLSASYGLIGSAGEYRLVLPFSLLAAMRKGFKLAAEPSAPMDSTDVTPEPLPEGGQEEPSDKKADDPRSKPKATLP
jgi:hypothetical protein